MENASVQFKEINLKVAWPQIWRDDIKTEDAKKRNLS